MILISEVIDKVIKKILSKRQHPVLVELMINWRKVVGLQLARSTFPFKILSRTERGVKVNDLYVQVANDTIKTELYYQQDIIIERIAIYCGYKAVHKLRLVVTNTTSNS